MAINEKFWEQFTADNSDLKAVITIEEKGYLSDLVNIQDRNGSLTLTVRLWDGPFNDPDTTVTEFTWRPAPTYLNNFFKIANKKGELGMPNLVEFLKYWTNHPLPVFYFVNDYGESLRALGE